MILQAPNGSGPGDKRTTDADILTLVVRSAIRNITATLAVRICELQECLNVQEPLLLAMPEFLEKNTIISNLHATQALMAQILIDLKGQETSLRIASREPGGAA